MSKLVRLPRVVHVEGFDRSGLEASDDASSHFDPMPSIEDGGRGRIQSRGFPRIGGVSIAHIACASKREIPGVDAPGTLSYEGDKMSAKRNVRAPVAVERAPKKVLEAPSPKKKTKAAATAAAPAPEVFQRFVDRFPKMGEAWNLLREEGRLSGKLEQREQILVKLAVAVGALRPGAVHSASRKALASGVTLDDLEQIVALAAPTIGLPSAVAAHQWIVESRKTRSRT